MTNGDKIRGMNNEELAQLLWEFSGNVCEICYCSTRDDDCNDMCKNNYGYWLEREVDE